MDGDGGAIRVGDMSRGSCGPTFGSEPLAAASAETSEPSLQFHRLLETSP
jgi:hypothetical protein